MSKQSVEEEPIGKSFVDGEPFVLTEADLRKPWSGFKDGRTLRCHLCGVFFRLGDTLRFVFVNGLKTGCHNGNFFVCQPCDGPDVIERSAKHEADIEQRGWWLMDRERLKPHPDLTKKK